jgi:hypothetical protein
VRHVIDKLDQTTATLDKKIDRTAADTHALIKFTYGELDRRVSALEEK